MSSYSRPASERLLAQALIRWRKLLVLRRAAILAAVATGMVLLLGIGMAVGWVTSAVWVGAGISLVLLGVMFIWLVTTLVTMCGPESGREPWLAAAVERCHRPLMDRLNTLVFLGSTRDKQLQQFAERIEQQTNDVLLRHPPALPFSPRLAFLPISLFAALLATTVLFYGYFRPWQYVLAAARGIDPAAHNDELFEIPPVREMSRESVQDPASELPWGDVRIIEPGMDLRVTSLDTIPLRIEAAASRPLKTVEWFTAINGATPDQHQLTPPDDPWHAVYHPELSMQDFAAEPWDVVRYHARATTEDGATYESEMYFIEVVPFRDELEELAASEPGPEYRQLEQLTSMIGRQNRVIRQTHRQSKGSNPSSATRKTHLRALAGEEAKLRQEASHLAAEMASQRDRSVTAGPDQHLQRAASSLENAEDSLLGDDLEQAAESERSALDQLVAARKEFQRSRREHGDASEPLAAQDSERRPDVGDAEADPLSDEIEDMAAHQQRLQTAREFVQKALQEERDLEKQADPRQQERFSQLAQQQLQLNDSLEKFVQENRLSFSRAESACSRAKSTMNQAAQSLDGESNTARQDVGRAADALQELDDRLEEQEQLWNHLSDAYRIREMLEQQISQLAQCQQSGFRPGQGGQLAAQAEFATNQLKQIAEGELSSEFFRDQLREALSDENMQRVAQQCQRLGQSGDPAGQEMAAGELEQTLQKVAQAFDASCRGGSSQGEQGDRLMPNGQGAIARGLRSLESAAGSRAEGRSLSNQDRARLVREAKANLMAGISSPAESNESSQPLIDQLEQELEEPAYLIDMQTVRELMREIQMLNRERDTDHSSTPVSEPTSNVDLSRLPAAYRQSIEKYFEKLSEQ